MMSRWEKFYKNSSGNHYPDRALITFFFKRLFKLKKKMLFLDLGCGTGSSFSLFSKKIKEKFKYGVILNTSFNLHGRTNVLTPKDAIIDFIDCNLDELFINGFKVTKKKV